MKRMIVFIIWFLVIGTPAAWGMQNPGGYSPVPVPSVPNHANTGPALSAVESGYFPTSIGDSANENAGVGMTGISDPSNANLTCQCNPCCSNQTGIGCRARSQRGPRYLSLDLGWSAVDANAEVLSMGQVIPPALDLDNAFLTRIGIGKHFGHWRVEGEVGLRQMKVGDVQLFYDEYNLAQGQRNTTSLMANLIYDLKIPGIVTPYGKLGLGASYNEVEGNLFVNPLGTNIFIGDVYPANESWEFAWSAGGGLGICLTHSLFLDLEYQYIDLGGASTGYNSVGSALGLGRGWNHEFTAGLRVNF